MKSLLNAASYVFGIMFNIFMLVLTIFLIFNLTERAFNYGKEFAEDLTAEKEAREVVIEVPDGADMSDIAKLLEKNGVIKSALFFRLESFFIGAGGTFKGGTYTVNANMDSIQLNRALSAQATSDIKITIREGYTLKDIAAYLEANEIVTAEEFLNACNGEFDFAFLNNVPMRENRLEGYLFPDTYFIAYDSTPEQIINKMLTRFEDIYNEDRRYQALKIDRSMDEIIIIASIIEKEIRVAEERNLASAVIYNRLASADPRLEMCSTIQYALEKRKDRLVDEDLKVESPYNTYLYLGLPVGPICNPGEASIRAALEPADSDFMYFVLKDEETGEHEFTRTYDEFLNAKNIYNQRF